MIINASLPRFSQCSPAQLEESIRAVLQKNRELLQTLLAQPQPYTWNNLMQPLEDSGDELSKTWAPMAHLHAVLESDELRKTYNTLLPLLTEYQTEISQNENLYQAILAIANGPEFAQFNPAQKKIIEDDIRDFRLAGIHLPKEQKEVMSKLQKQLSQLTTTFSENVLDATQGWTLHLIDQQQLEGLPPQALQLAIDNAKARNVDGFIFTLDYPSYSTAIKFLKNRELRKILYEAYSTRASDCGPNAGKWDNSTIMEKILKTRHDMATLVGFDNFAAYSLATKMAKTPEDVLRFLRDLIARSKNIASNELNEVAALAKTMDGMTHLEVWDFAYYSEKLQQTKFKFSQEDIRPYFPINKVLQGLFTIVNKLYGITVREEKEVDVWHPDVRFFSILDENNQARAGFYIDLYARPHKRDGAWMDECQARRVLATGETQLPIAFLTCNFMQPVGNQPALLTHDDVLTVFHEFGHCLHHMLTKVNYPSVAGINGVPWDAVEFPSQMMENFCWEKEVLAMIAGHYQTNASLPDELYQKMKAAKHFQTGLQMLRQLEFALFDFRLHLEYDARVTNQIRTILEEVRQEAAVLQMPTFNRFQNSFSHIFSGGYAAGYYSYKWAEVLSADAYAQFEENGVLDRATGVSFMQNMLEVGGVRDPMASFVLFRGREPTIQALLAQSGIE